MNPIGPETPAVYWRRRLLVGLAAVVALFVLWLLIFGGGGDSATPVTTPTQSAVPSIAPSQIASASASATSTEGLCADTDIEVSTQVDKQTYPLGTPIVFKMLIKNTSAVECTRDVGPKVNTIKVTSGTAAVWSSDDCNDAGPNQLEKIPAGGSFAVQATWDQQLTQAGCPSNLGKATAGGYDVTGINMTVTGKATAFSIQ